MDDKRYNNLFFIIAIIAIVLSCTISISNIKENESLKREITHLKFNNSIYKELLKCDSVVIDTTFTLKPLIK